MAWSKGILLQFFSLNAYSSRYWLFISHEGLRLTLRQAKTFGKRTSPSEFFVGFITEGYSKYFFAHLLWKAIAKCICETICWWHMFVTKITRPYILNTPNATNNHHNKPHTFSNSSCVAIQQKIQPWNISKWGGFNKKYRLPWGPTVSAYSAKPKFHSLLFISFSAPGWLSVLLGFSGRSMYFDW